MYNLVIKDKNNSIIKRNHVCGDKHFHIIAREIFYIELIDYTKSDNSPYIPTLHSVREVNGNIIHLSTDEDTNMLFGNFCYSLYFTENNQEVTIRIIQPTTNQSMVYKICYYDGNQIDETNSHYLDLLTNYYLPSLEELGQAMVNSGLYDKREMLKRLLLDFKEITRNKGTKQAVENFFKFLGYDDDVYTTQNNQDLSTIKLYEEFRKDDGSLTLEPDKYKDVKTGRYHVLYDYYHYLDPIYDENNLPNIEIVIDDYEDFMNRVMYAIQLANIYFTLDEQEIIFFNSVFSSNAPTFQNIQSSTVISSQYDIMHFRHDLNINAFVNETQNSVINKVVDKVQLSNVLNATEIKYVLFTTADIDFMMHNNNFHRINREIFDDEEIADEDFNQDSFSIVNEQLGVTNDLDFLYRKFGAILHIRIDVLSHLELEYKFYLKSLYDPTDPYTYIQKDRMFVSEPVIDQFACFKNTIADDVYVLEVSVYDDTNNKETYFYEFTLNEDDLFINTESYNSAFIYDNLSEIEAYRDQDCTDRINELDVSYNDDNRITIDVTAADSSLDTEMLTFTYEDLSQITIPNYVLPVNEIIGNDLTQYYNNPDFTNVSWLNGGVYDLNNTEKFYKGFKLKDTTESLPIGLIEPFVDMIAFPDDGRNLKLKVYNPDLPNGYMFVDVNTQNIHDDNPLNDCILITKMDVLEQPNNNVLGTYWVIMTTITGVELTKEYLDFWLVDGYNDESVYELNNILRKQVPVNFDIPLLINNVDIQEIYSSDTGHYINIKANDDVVYPVKCIKSVYPRLVNRKKQIFVSENGNIINKDLYTLKINDLIFCKLDENYNDTHFDTTWEVRDSFDNNILLHSSHSKNLKYRVNRKTCLDIICKTTKYSNVNGQKEIIIFKQSINSSMDKFELI